MGKRYRIILFLFFTANMVFAESNLDSLLVNLDQTILQHEIYKDRREARIRELKGKQPRQLRTLLPLTSSTIAFIGNINLICAIRLSSI